MISVEASGRTLVPGKRGAISKDLAPGLERLGFDQLTWNEAMKSFRERPAPVAGTPAQMKSHAELVRDKNGSWYRGFRKLGDIFA